MNVFLNSQQILVIHDYVIQETGGTHGLRDPQALESAVGRPSSGFSGSLIYSDVFSQSAALIESLMLNHDFVDGNTRAAATAAGTALSMNRWKLTATNQALIDLTYAVADGNLRPSIAEIASWFEAQTVKRDI